ncbi:hypothetical protein HMPREF9440_02532 [Sutterella parvirubra YIT 11816]|uniref:Uncharacterized protein n=1 Tax=Sutterella parvirubra YIT 11816 TaxID=762967 RepID=H3KIC0_9BURK|nr:hypothetical protein HMPREF9440_02532 [Sutterella parvirubra YIT 11816]
MVPGYFARQLLRTFQEGCGPFEDKIGVRFSGWMGLAFGKSSCEEEGSPSWPRFRPILTSGAAEPQDHETGGFELR